MPSDCDVSVPPPADSRSVSVPLAVAAPPAVWGLLADVHANLAALDRALLLLEAAGATRLAFLGDYLGRGDPDACVRRIQQVADVAIVGNRDLDWQDRVAAPSRDWVRSLPRQVQLGPLLLAHGDARLTPGLSTAEIRSDFRRAWRAMDHTGARVFAFGHSHHARTWRKTSLDAAAEPLASSTLPLAPAPARTFLNVGTTGLPFPGKGGPSVAIVDLIAREIRHLSLDQR